MTRTRLIGGLVAGAVVALVGAAAPCRAAPAPSPAPPLKVMTFNIRYGTALDGANRWSRRRPLVVGVIWTYEPAVVGLQEALRFQLDQLREELPAYDKIGVGRRDGRKAGEYAAILYDARRLEVLDEGTFWFSDTPKKPGSKSWGNRITRICTWGRFRDREAGRTFYLFNVHWDHKSQPSRERSAELLAARIAAREHPEDPVVVTGDFNAAESSLAMTRLRESGLVDTFRALHPAAGQVGTFNGFKGDTCGEKFDAVLVSPGWSVLEAAIDRTRPEGRYPSDHFPVTAILRYPEDAAIPVPSSGGP